MKKILIFPLFIALFISCGRSKSVEEIRKEIEAKRTGNEPDKDYHIEVITDPDEVARIKSEIESALESRNEEPAEEDVVQESSLVDQYKLGNKSVIPEIIYSLGFSDSSERAGIYNELRSTWNAPDNYSITEKSLIRCIFEHFDHPQDAAMAISVAAQMKIKDYQQKLEQKIASSNQSGIGRAFYFLSLPELAKPKYAEQILKLVNENKIPEQEKEEIAQSLNQFASNTNPKINTPALEACLVLYAQEIKPYLDSTNQVYNNSIGYQIISALMEKGDQTIIPIADELIEHNLYPYNAINAYIRLEPAIAREKIIEALQKPDHYETVIYSVAYLPLKYRDEAIMTAMLQGLQDQEILPGYTIEYVLFKINEWGGKKLIENADQFISSSEVRQRVSKRWMHMQMDCSEIADELYASGLMLNPIAPEVIDSATIELTESEYMYSCLYNMLENSGIYTFIYMEDGYLEESMEGIAESLSGNSNGILSSAIYIEENLGTEDFPEYKFSFVYKDRAYIGTSSAYGFEMIVDIANLALEDAGIVQRFFMFGDQKNEIIFGIDADVQKFAARFLD